MSLSLGLIAERVSLTLAFLTLGLIYSGAVFAATRARSLALRDAPASPAPA